MSILESLARSLMVAALATFGVSGHAQDGVSKTAIVIGQSVALTGPGSALAVPFHQGAKIYFDRINAAGGLELFANQSSGVLTSCTWADGLIDNPPGQAIRRGDTVRFLPFSELL